MESLATSEQVSSSETDVDVEMIGRAVRFTHTLPVRCLVKVTTPLPVEVLEVHCEFALDSYRGL